MTPSNILVPKLWDLREVYRARGFDLRLVGGCVRDLLMGKVPHDVDLHTDATPDEQIQILDNAGVRWEPTGLSHGTVTVVLDHVGYEITSLRQDVSTDGRRATIDRGAHEADPLEFERNQERYTFLRWGQGAFRNFKVVPPETGIVHQVNIEHLARVVMVRDGVAYPDTCVGTDSHTTMQNGLGVLGWGVGGIEAEAAMLGQPVSMLIPRVVGFKLYGELPAGTTATDLVLTITELLRKHGVVGKFVEFYGPGVASVPMANRATIGNMSPEYGSTCAIFPIDDETLRYLRLTGRSSAQVELVERYAKSQGLWHDPNAKPRGQVSDAELHGVAFEPLGNVVQE